MDVKAKKLRREGFVTGNVFGKEIKGSIPIKIEKKEADRLLKTENKGGQVILDIEGQSINALIKEIDFNPLKGQVDEIDFQALVNGEKVHSVAEIILHNHEKVQSGVLQQLLHEISYKALPSALVEKITVDVGGMRVGDSIKVKDLDIAKDKDVHLLTDMEAIVATVSVSKNNGEPAEDEEAAEESAE